MNWKVIGQAAGAASVVLSLLFVGYEIRQNTAVARMSAAQAFTQQIIDLNAVLIAEGFPLLQARMLEGSMRADFSPDEQFIIDVNHLSLLRIWESTYRSVQEGIVDRNLLQPLEGETFGPFGLPYFRESWPQYRRAFTADFATYFERAQKF